MNAANHLLPFDVRPAHRETLESYSRRLLDANFCDDSHRAALTRQFQTERTVAGQKSAWMLALSSKTRRDTLHLDAHPNGWLTHQNGACQHFRKALPTRFACTLCTHGSVVEQNPHFDSIVCAHHQRWLGLWGNAGTQHRVDAAAVSAQKVFDNLRRKRLIDVRLYLLVAKSLAESQHPGLGIEDAEPRVFAQAIALIQAITTDQFARSFFKPTETFAAAHALLKATVETSTNSCGLATTNDLWIYLRETMLSLREAMTGRSAYMTTWDHDYPIRRAIALDLAAYRGTLEPEDRYLDITGDTTISAARRIAALSTPQNSTDAVTPRWFTCTSGHSFQYLPPVEPAAATTPARFVPTCGQCTIRRVQTGTNDVQSTSQTAAAQFDLLRNGGLTAADISKSSSTEYWWLCPNGHSHKVSASKKTLPTYGCPICSNRGTQIGVNCFLTTHPEYAAMWAMGWSEDRSPSTFSAGAKLLGRWRCNAGHIFPARPYELASGTRGCNICARERTIAQKESLATTHPDEATRWHPTLNRDLTPAHVTHGERREVWWNCQREQGDAHAYRARIDKISAGQGCSVCSSRKLVRGVNDLGTLEPMLSIELHLTRNHKNAHEIFPSDTKLWWQCLFNNHVHAQTVQNRRQSRGCPKCRFKDRILVY